MILFERLWVTIIMVSGIKMCTNPRKQWLKKKKHIKNIQISNIMPQTEYIQIIILNFTAKTGSTTKKTKIGKIWCGFSQISKIWSMLANFSKFERNRIENECGRVTQSRLSHFLTIFDVFFSILEILVLVSESSNQYRDGSDLRNAFYCRMISIK